jgi:hypothetical protein
VDTHPCVTGNIYFITAQNFSFKQTLICCALPTNRSDVAGGKSGLHVSPEGPCKPTPILIYRNANKGNIFMSCSSIHAGPGYRSDAVHTNLKTAELMHLCCTAFHFAYSPL